jgi:hypothetical protein
MNNYFYTIQNLEHAGYYNTAKYSIRIKRQMRIRFIYTVKTLIRNKPWH